MAKHVAEVQFRGTEKVYTFFVAGCYSLQRDCWYDIIADERTAYSNPVLVKQVFKVNDNHHYYNELRGIRTITSARLLMGNEACENDRIHAKALSRKGEFKAESDSLIISTPYSINNSPIKNVLYNPRKRVTTVQWVDGSYTTVKRDENEEFDIGTAIAMAFMKKAYGNTGRFKKEFTKWANPTQIGKSEKFKEVKTDD